MIKYYLMMVLILNVVLSQGQVSNTIQDDYLITVVGSPPVFEGDLMKFIKDNFDYPEGAKRDSIEGTVYVSYWIDTLGNTVKHEIIRGLREDLDLEALRIARLIKYDKPAMQRSKPICVRLSIPIKFELHPLPKNEVKHKKRFKQTANNK